MPISFSARMRAKSAKSQRIEKRKSERAARFSASRVVAFQMQTGTPWIWVAISGVVTTLLGVMVLAQWPYSGLFVIGLFFGVDLVFAGAGWVGFGLALRNRT